MKRAMYRIITNGSKFKVQKLDRLWFWTYWTTLGHNVCEGLGFADATVSWVDHEFNTRAEAETFMQQQSAVYGDFLKSEEVDDVHQG